MAVLTGALRKQACRARSTATARIAAGTVAAIALLIYSHSRTQSADGSAFALRTTTKQHFFAWMGWSPEPGTHLFQQLENNFPGALPGKVVVPRIVEALEPYGVAPNNSIYGQSLCSDEINTEKEHMSADMTEYWGHVFPLGGIGGAPYVGKTGFGAFSHHVPEDGNVILLFGPHVGISPDGQVGKFLRCGQHSLSSACGALVAAFNQLTSTPTLSDFEHDMEQSWLRSRLQPYVKEIQAAADPMVELAKKAYFAIEKEIMEVGNIDFGSGYLVLIGGVQINMPGAFQDHFMPIHFSIRSKDMHPVNLLNSFA